MYLDITGIEHHVWAALVRSALENRIPLQVVYSEPRVYTPNINPADEASLFDLSEGISGIAPLPGFVSLRAHDVSPVLIALLGFEGARSAFVVETVQPEQAKLVPLVGVPGFEAEYPFHTYLGNRKTFEAQRAWRNVQFARASCPFSVMYKLQDIAARYEREPIQIALIGTKPHALGAVLFYLNTTRDVELIYDFPIRKSTRTKGVARVHVYNLSAALPGGIARSRGATPPAAKM